MHSELSFNILMDGTPYPVKYDPTILAEFEREYVDAMDEELKKFSDEFYGPTFFLDRDNRLGVVAPLIRQAVQEKDGTLVAKYVLWMATRYPEISGIQISRDTYKFEADIFSVEPPEGYKVH